MLRISVKHCNNDTKKKKSDFQDIKHYDTYTMYMAKTGFSKNNNLFEKIQKSAENEL